MTTPNEVGHLTVMAASFIITVVGALGTQLPRNGSYTDRVSDTKLNELKGDK